MIGRNMRGSRQASLKVRVGVAAAVLAGGSAVGVAAVAAGNHATATTAQSAGFSSRHTMSAQTMLHMGVATWSRHHGGEMTAMAKMTPMGTFRQVRRHGTMNAAQMGVVVRATNRFLLVKTVRGVLRRWWITAHTQFVNVTPPAPGTGTAPATPPASPTGTQTAAGSMSPAMTATPSGTPTMMAAPSPSAAPTMPVTMTPHGVARGDLVAVMGIRVHGFLIAKVVLFVVPPKTMPTTSPTATPSMTATPTGSPTMTGTTPTKSATPVPTGTTTFSGVKS